MLNKFLIVFAALLLSVQVILAANGMPTVPPIYWIMGLVSFVGLIWLEITDGLD